MLLTSFSTSIVKLLKNKELVNLMPMLIKIVELDFSWPSLNSGLYWVALGLYRCRNS